jgi:hypothetical protein
MSAIKRIFLGCMILGLSGLGGACADLLDFGPLASRFRMSLEAGQREEWVGPLYYHQHTDSEDLSAMPPLWSSVRNHEIDSVETDVLYPILTYDRFGEEYRWQLFQWINLASGRVSQTETNAHRFTLFPFYFQQRSAVADQDYTAVFPFYGKLKNRLFRDEIEFAAWPIYVKTVRRQRYTAPAEDSEFTGALYRYFEQRRGDVTTYNIVVPFFHVRVGSGLRGWQFWPLYGHEEKKATTWTNQWDEVVQEGGHRRTFALWPFYFKNDTELGTPAEEHMSAVLPFYSRSTSSLRESITAPWPIGITHTVDRARKYEEWGYPWPFVVFARGEGKTTSRVWPFYGHSHNDSLEKNYYLWPFYRQDILRAESVERERVRILLFLYSDIHELNKETGKLKRRTDLWPLFTYGRDWEGRERWQMGAVLEPLLPTSKSIERNYSHLWSLVRAERNPATGASSESLLWNLYRRDSVTNQHHESLLFGLVQWDVTPEGRQARWFYLPWRTRY